MEATAVPDMKNSSSTIFFRCELEQSKRWRVEGTWRENRGSVQDGAASDRPQPPMANARPATVKRNLNFCLNSTLEKSHLCIRNKDIIPPTSTLWLWSGAPPPHHHHHQAGQLGSCSCILTQRGFVHLFVGADGKAGKAG